LLLLIGFGFLAASATSMTWAGFTRSEIALASPPGFLLLLPAWAVSAWLLHRSLDRWLPGRDPLLLPCGLLLMGWGVLVVWRLLPEFGARQLAWFLAVTGIIYEVGRMRGILFWLRRYRLAWLLLGLGLLALTLYFGTNPSGAEARLWLGCCGLYMQPSELLRLLLIAYLASYFADRLMPGSDEPSRRGLWPILLPLIVVWGVAVALLAAQRDLGTGSLILALLAVLLFVVSRRWEALAVGIVLLLAAGLAAMALSGVVQARVESWLNPWNDPLASSYQTLQGLLAMAVGGIGGTGPGLGAPGIVPAAHTDLVFAAVVEEWGLAGGLGLLGLLAVVTSRGLRAATQARDPYAAILGAGLTIAISLQAFLILGGVLRVLPLTGVPLPFVSYGGSSLLTTGLSLALLIRISALRSEKARFASSIRTIHTAGLLMWAVLALTVGWWTVVRGPELRARPENPRPEASRVADGLAVLARPEEYGRRASREVQPGSSFRRLDPSPFWKV
jgi:cell division protein FtsW (lipid II flippase)